MSLLQCPTCHRVFNLRELVSKLHKQGKSATEIRDFLIKRKVFINYKSNISILSSIHTMIRRSKGENNV